MGRKRQRQGGPNQNNGSRNPISIRDEITGIKHGIGGTKNAKYLPKHEYLTKLAVWAGGEAIPNLAAFFGQQVAALGEALTVSPDPSFISCQRCESILQPGFNCTIRIEKNKSRAKRRHKKKPGLIVKNNVVFKCNFCSHRNLMKGTPKGYLKEICPPRSKVSVVLESTKSVLPTCSNLEKGIAQKEETTEKNNNALPSVIPLLDVSPTKNHPQTPVARTFPTLLDIKRNRKKSASKKTAEAEIGSAITDDDKSISTRNKRKKKSWTSLKEIAESSEHNRTRSIADLTIPFKL